jgi:hypothetical protein
VSELAVPLESIGPCLQGVLPSWLVTCSAEGVPNATILSIVRYVDSERVALTRQFFNKTRANLDENPQAQVIVVDPGSGDQFARDLRYLHTESEGLGKSAARRRFFDSGRLATSRIGESFTWDREDALPESQS